MTRRAYAPWPVVAPLYSRKEDVMTLRSLLPFGREAVPMRSNGDLFATLHRDLDRLFDTMMTSPMTPAWNGRMMPCIDVRETDKGLDITAELPGVDEKDVDITLDGGMLTIRGEKRMADETGEAAKEALGVHMSERSYGSFLRTVPLPFEVDEDHIEASCDNGVLKITLPRSPTAQTKGRKIPLTHH